MIVQCQRCGKEAKVTTGSFFDTSIICMGCEELEKKHPNHAQAKKVEGEHVKAGDYNYAGIGLPPDWNDFVLGQKK